MSRTKTPRWADIDGVMEHLALSRTTIYKLMDAGTIKGYKIGGARRFDLNQIDDAIRSGK